MLNFIITIVILFTNFGRLLLFFEQNISRNDNFLGLEIQQFVSFCVLRTPNHYGFGCPVVQLFDVFLRNRTPIL
jgi:hypothetical protein